MLLDGLARARRAQRRCGRGVLLSDYSVEPLSLIGYGLCGLLVAATWSRRLPDAAWMQHMVGLITCGHRGFGAMRPYPDGACGPARGARRDRPTATPVAVTRSRTARRELRIKGQGGNHDVKSLRVQSDSSPPDAEKSRRRRAPLYSSRIECAASFARELSALTWRNVT